MTRPEDSTVVEPKIVSAIEDAVGMVPEGQVSEIGDDLFDSSN